MKVTRYLVLIACALTLAACHSGRDVTIEGHSITLHAAHAPKATITSRGSFSVGAKAVDTSRQQRQALAEYYQDVLAVHEGAEQMKNAGLAMAGSSLHLAAHSIEHAVGAGSARSAQDKATSHSLQARGHRLENKAHQLCRKVHKLKTLQATLAAQVTAFQPYANVDPAPQVHCRD